MFRSRLTNDSNPLHFNVTNKQMFPTITNLKNLLNTPERSAIAKFAAKCPRHGSLTQHICLPATVSMAPDKQCQ